MTYVKKMKDEWQPQEHRGVRVGDVVDFPGSIEMLVREGSVIPCDAEGNEVSTYDTMGIITERELEEFRAWREIQKQEGVRKSLESEHEELLAEAKKFKTKRTDEEKKAWGKRMAEARKAKKSA